MQPSGELFELAQRARAIADAIEKRDQATQRSLVVGRERHRPARPAGGLCGIPFGLGALGELPRRFARLIPPAGTLAVQPVLEFG